MLMISLRSLRYVDVFILFNSKDHLLSFSRNMSTRHKSLKFTFHFEQNNSFYFLGVEISRGNQGFSMSVFRKRTLSGVFTTLDSFVSESYKDSIPKDLLSHHVYNFLCSNCNIIY